MKIQIENQKLSINGKHYCDTARPKVTGAFPVKFQHSEDFNALMPFLSDDVLICWGRELCRKESSCEYCNAVQVGRRSTAGTLIEQRATFNQLYDKIKHRSGSTYELIVEISG